MRCFFIALEIEIEIEIEIQKAAALEIIQSNYEDYYKIYTDGSLDPAESKSGAGYFAERSNESFFVPANSCSSTDTELLAINAAVAHCMVIESQKICILSDSKSALQLLKQYKPSSYYHRIQEIFHLLNLSTDKEICFQWIPGHCGLQGNEKADRIAKAATNMHPIPSKELTLTSCIAASQRLLTQKWVEKWKDEPTGRHLYDLLKEPNNTDIYKNLPRSVSTFASRARTGHIVTQSYLFRFQLAESPLCLVCQTEEETLQHILLHCTRKLDIRDELRKRLQPDCTLGRILTDPTYWRLANLVYERHRAVGIT
ncbi:uncharacterized protein LOC128985061 [Macrosteles quadrilineatus]|uniref:uncharacterized protein LOC128985061 n=1 Tax=Macrosteles quadrilineatus TaxID=74068 RepID=UPI0023E0C868|nr:uncharacterized protein LOC128985061 [Macrosteles quadrilineatus]